MTSTTEPNPYLENELLRKLLELRREQIRILLDALESYRWLPQRDIAEKAITKFYTIDDKTDIIEEKLGL